MEQEAKVTTERNEKIIYELENVTIGYTKLEIENEHLKLINANLKDRMALLESYSQFSRPSETTAAISKMGNSPFEAAPFSQSKTGDLMQYQVGPFSNSGEQYMNMDKSDWELQENRKTGGFIAESNLLKQPSLTQSTIPASHQYFLKNMNAEMDEERKLSMSTIKTNLESKKAKLLEEKSKSLSKTKKKTPDLRIKIEEPNKSAQIRHGQKDKHIKISSIPSEEHQTWNKNLIIKNNEGKEEEEKLRNKMDPNSNRKDKRLSEYTPLHSSSNTTPHASTLSSSQKMHSRQSPTNINPLPFNNNNQNPQTTHSTNQNQIPTDNQQITKMEGIQNEYQDINMKIIADSNYLAEELKELEQMGDFHQFNKFNKFNKFNEVNQLNQVEQLKDIRELAEMNDINLIQTLTDSSLGVDIADDSFDDNLLNSNMSKGSGEFIDVYSKFDNTTENSKSSNSKFNTIIVRLFVFVLDLLIEFGN